jgi:hypothetical protein
MYGGDAVRAEGLDGGGVGSRDFAHGDVLANDGTS